MQDSVGSASKRQDTPVRWTMEAAPAPETLVSGRRVLYFAGTGYLGLQRTRR